MKHILFITFLLSIFSCTKHNGYSLSGEVPEAWEGKPVFLMLNDINQPYAIDSTQISNGKFLLKGKFDIPRYCSVLIYLDPNNRSDRSKLVNFSLFLDSTAVKAV